MIFVSYSSQDRDRASEIVELLKGAGYEVAWDADLAGGEAFRDELLKSINASQAVVVLWTHYAVRSRFVRDEADVALKRERLIPVLGAGLTIDEIPLGFRDLHVVPELDRPGILRALALKGITPAARLRPIGYKSWLSAGGWLTNPYLYFGLTASIALFAILPAALVGMVIGAVATFAFVALYFRATRMPPAPPAEARQNLIHADANAASPSIAPSGEGTPT